MPLSSITFHMRYITLQKYIFVCFPTLSAPHTVQYRILLPLVNYEVCKWKYPCRNLRYSLFTYELSEGHTWREVRKHAGISLYLSCAMCKPVTCQRCVRAEVATVTQDIT
jgi:hypothetical protein